MYVNENSFSALEVPRLLRNCPHALDFFFFFHVSFKYIYNWHRLSCQEKVSRFSMLPISCNRTSLAVSHWKLRMVLVVEYRSTHLNKNKPFSGPVSTLLSSGFFRIFLWFFCNLNTQKPHLLIGRVKNSDFLIVSELKSVC